MNCEAPVYHKGEYLSALEWRFGATCMGGFCVKRDTCARYLPGSLDADPIERMCVGSDRSAYVPLIRGET